jgi:hypothetical protein
LQVDNTGTIADTDRLVKLKESIAHTIVNGDVAEAADETGAINENLFLDEDLDGLEDELNDLDVNNIDESDSEDS